MGTADGTEPGADRSWPARHGGGYPRGWQVRYRSRRPAGGPPLSQERIGTVAGPSLRDEHTGTTWVPIRPFCAVSGTPLRLVRATDVLDACPPGEPASEDDEGRPATVIADLPERDSGDGAGEPR